MIYNRYLALMLVIGILSCEPATAVQSGSLNQCNTELVLNSQINYGNTFKNNYLNNLGETPTFKDKIKQKKSIKLIINKINKHKSLKNLSHNLHTDQKNRKVICNSSNNSLNNSNDTIIRLKSSLNISVDDKNVTSLYNSSKYKSENITADKKAYNQTEFANNQTNINKSTNNSCRINGAVNSANVTNENYYLNNSHSNNTVNSTNSSFNAISEDSTKDKVTDTLLAVGYASAAIAAACAMNPEPLASKIICAVAVTVAVVSFVAVIFIKWFL